MKGRKIEEDRKVWKTRWLLPCVDAFIDQRRREDRRGQYDTRAFHIMIQHIESGVMY